MKSAILFLIGLVVGVVTTYMIRLPASKAFAAQALSEQMRNHTAPWDGKRTPDDNSEALILKDSFNLIDRDLCIATWYLDEYLTLDNLGIHTGHQFGPVWNKRSPVEIVEEELAFSKAFEAESKRLEAHPEQGGVAKP